MTRVERVKEFVLIALFVVAFAAAGVYLYFELPAYQDAIHMGPGR